MLQVYDLGAIRVHNDNIAYRKANIFQFRHILFIYHYNVSSSDLITIDLSIPTVMATDRLGRLKQ
jgi:hypothetical protein